MKTLNAKEAIQTHFCLLINKCKFVKKGKKIIKKKKKNAVAEEERTWRMRINHESMEWLVKRT